MIFDPQLVQMIVVVGAVIAYFGYQFFGKARNQAKEETATTYKELNDALEKKIIAVETLQKDCRSRISDLENKLGALTAEKANVENLLVRALREFFAANPKLTEELQDKLYTK